MPQINLVIIEDSLSIRKNLVEVFKLDNEIVSICEFDSIETFLSKKDELSYPDVILLDIQLPKLNGDEAIDTILLSFPDVNILIYSMYMDSSTIIKCISKGAVGYVLKSQHSISDILEAIKIVNKGGSFLSPSIARKVLNHFHPSREAKVELSLTIREEQVMNGLMNALTYQQIANELNISIDTVRTYIKKIYGKIQVNNKAQLVNKIQKYIASKGDAALL